MVSGRHGIRCRSSGSCARRQCTTGRYLDYLDISTISTHEYLHSCVFDMVEYNDYCFDFRLDERQDMHSWDGAMQVLELLLHCCC